MASLAQFESNLISQRVKAGMERAKAQGKNISRPRLSGQIQKQIKQMYLEGKSIKKIRNRLWECLELFQTSKKRAGEINLQSEFYPI